MAGYFARYGIASGALLGMLLMANTAALADTTLICTQGPSLDMGPTTFTLNEAQNTVTLHLPAINGGEIPARTVGPFPGTFRPDTIDFSYEDGELRHTYVINRLSAAIDETAVSLGNGPPFSRNYACQVGTKQF